MIGKIVKWRSCGLTKTGKIVAVVPPKVDVVKFFHLNFHEDTYRFTSYGGGGPRNYHSFLIELMPNIPAKKGTFKQLYWPSMNKINKENPNLWQHT